MAFSLGQMKDMVSREMAVGVNTLQTANTFVTSDDVVHYLNEGQREFAKRVLKMNQNYFRTYIDIPIDPTVGDVYPLPANIFVLKILELSYFYTGNFYRLELIDLDTFLTYQSDYSTKSTVPEGYFLIDRTGEGKEQSENPFNRHTEIHFVPPDSLGSSDKFRIYYLRDVRDMSLDTDFPDIPNIEDVLMAYARNRISEVDSTRSSENYFKKFEFMQKNALESMFDRTPRPGGTPLELDYSDLAGAMEPWEAG